MGVPGETVIERGGGTRLSGTGVFCLLDGAEKRWGTGCWVFPSRMRGGVIRE